MIDTSAGSRVASALQALRDRHPGLVYAQAGNERIIHAIASGDRTKAWQDIAIRHEEPPTAEDVNDALTIYAAHRAALEISYPTFGHKAITIDEFLESVRA